MNSPFQFGQIVEGEAFTDREESIKRLINNFNSGVNTILISPRKWGKSSLVKKVSKILRNESSTFKFCFLDLMKIMNEEEFYKSFAQEIIKQTLTKPEEIWQIIKTFFKRVTPKISFGSDPINDFEISFELKNIEKEFDEILDLPEHIAEQKNIKIIVCIDEFQDFGNFTNPALFQKRLRSVFQHHKRTSYCFCGSKKDMMINLFEKKTMPFYKFGDLFFLPKISKEELINFIIHNFERTGKIIDYKFAQQITELMDCHSYYTQQLSHLIWVNTEKEVTEIIFEKSIADMLNQNTYFFEREIEGLSIAQIRFLKAICAGVTEGFTRADVIKKYQLSSSANVIKVKKSLILKQIIDVEQSKISFLDPAFQLWFKNNYLG